MPAHNKNCNCEYCQEARNEQKVKTQKAYGITMNDEVFELLDYNAKEKTGLYWIASCSMPCWGTFKKILLRSKDDALNS